MIDVSSLPHLQAEVRACVRSDSDLLDRYCGLVRDLRRHVRRIHPYSTTAVAFVGTDGGNNLVEYDPFLIQLIRVVDSSNEEYCLEVITPRTPMGAIDARHLDREGHGRTALGRMMEALEVRRFVDLSQTTEDDSARKPTWILAYRELTEWAILLDLIRTRQFANDTVILQDGLLRSKVFGKHLRKYVELLTEAIAVQYRRSHRRIYVAGVAKQSKILQAFQLAMSMEGVLRTSYPAYVEVPEELQREVIKWEEYIRRFSLLDDGRQVFNAGRMHWVKFGSMPHDPIWSVDLLESQVGEADTILGYILNDAVSGFPIPYYPLCLQRAHEHAALVDLDFDILQDEVLSALREVIGAKRTVVDEARLQTADTAQRRYS